MDDSSKNLRFNFSVLNRGEKALKARTIAVSKVSSTEKEALFQLFNAFYENVSFEVFLKDFEDKDKVIILYDKSGVPRGFSTIKFFDHYVESLGKNLRVFFSGDTIVHPDYWGKHDLNIQIAINMFKTKIMAPHRHTVWLLLTKGYKTYLLLTNSFSSYYPRLNRKTPSSIKKIMGSLGQKLYGKNYNANKGIIQLDNKDKLASFVAPIDAELCARVPKINFFREQNPNWESGSELLCIGNISFYLLFVFYPFKLIRKQTRVLMVALGLKKNIYSR